MAQSSSIISHVAEVYAGSLYDLAVEAGSVATIEKSLAEFGLLIGENQDLRRLIESPVISADEQYGAMNAIAEKAGIDTLLANFLAVVARNRRLFAVPAMISAFHRIAAEKRGEVTAEVSSAHTLTPAQNKELKAALKEVAGQDISINVTIEPSLLAGLVVKMGSKQIDSSLKTKLNSLKLALKEVG